MKIKIHPLFWLVAIAAFWTGQFIELMTLFFLVIVHELGHVVIALSLGWRVQSMELLPFGGVAKVDEWGTTKSRDEILVALAGPFVNLAMILFGYLLFSIEVWERDWSLFFIEGNAVIAAFNLLPVWPLDGGKVLHATLTKIYSFYSSIYVTLAWSCFCILLLMVYSFFFSSPLNLFIICLYLLVEIRVAWKRAHYQFIRYLLDKLEQIKSRKEMLKVKAIYILPSDKIKEVVKMIKKGSYHYFYAFDTGSNRMVHFPEEVILNEFFKKPGQTLSDLISEGKND